MNKKFFMSLLTIMMVAFMGVSFVSCGNDETEEMTPQPTDESTDVQVCFVYTLDTSNGSSMTRAAGDEIFDQFYAKISSGEMVPDDYDLTLTETTTGVKYYFVGKWSAKNMITLRTGKYKVEGVSKAPGSYVQEKCSLSFDEEIEVTSSSNTITLKASYDCSLLVFTDTNISRVYYSDNGAKRDLYNFNSYIYAFVNGNFKDNDNFQGEYTNGSYFRIFTKGLKFDKGKYYIYNSISNNFSIPKMEQGE